MIAPEGLLFLTVAVSVVVGGPTVGMARRSLRDGRGRLPWTLSTLVVSLLVPILGPISLWVVYAATADAL